jgi:pimeloyl-ACP methyl ester carboxylesterase
VDLATATSHVELDGLRLRYLDVGPASAGRGTETLMVIPGHTARIEGFADLVPLLAERHRVLVLDLPGTGGSDKPDRPYDLRSYEDAIVAFLDHLGVERAVPVGGSLGGNLVLRLAHRFPARFPRLVLWAPGGAWTARPRAAALLRRLLADGPLGRPLFWPTVRIQSRYWYAEGFADRERHLAETFAYYRTVLSPGFVRMYWGIAADQIGHSLFAIAPEITQPSLLLWGDQDHGAGMGKGVARLHQLIPGNELVVLPGRRHSLEVEAPAVLAAHIAAFAAADPLPPPPSPPTPD